MRARDLTTAAFLLVHLTSCTEQLSRGQEPESHPANLIASPFADQIGEYVTEVIEDQGGNLWFGTLGRGAARYDGAQLTYFTSEDGLSSGPVTSIAVDLRGTVWFGTHDGVARYDGADFSVMGEEQGLPGANGSVATDRSGRIWISTDQGVYRDTGDGFARFEVPVDPGAVTHYAIRKGRTSFGCEDRDGNLWFRTDGLGALRFDGTTFRSFRKADGLCSDTVNSILADDQGSIWFICMQAYQPQMTGDGGLCRYDGQSFIAFDEVDGLHGNDIYSLYEDRAGHIWIGATGLGVYRWASGRFTLFDDIERRDLTPNIGITGILEHSGGTMWFGLCGGLFRLAGETLVNVRKDGPWK